MPATFTSTKTLSMWRMSNVTQLPTDENMSNLLLFSISLHINVSCLIMRTWKNNFNYWKWHMFPSTLDWWVELGNGKNDTWGFVGSHQNGICSCLQVIVISMDKVTTMNWQHLVVVYPFICGATMENDYDYVLHGNNGIFAISNNIFGSMLKCLIFLVD